MIGRWLGGIGALALASVIGIGCAASSRTLLVGTQDSVGTDATIEISHLREDVNLVKVELINLPPPERFTKEKGLKHFVVWIKPATKDAIPVKAGRLAYDPIARRGILEATSPANIVYVMVTAEKSSKVTKPGKVAVVNGHAVLKNNNDSEDGGGI